MRLGPKKFAVRVATPWKPRGFVERLYATRAEADRAAMAVRRVLDDLGDENKTPIVIAIVV